MTRLPFEKNIDTVHLLIYNFINDKNVSLENKNYIKKIFPDI